MGTRSLTHIKERSGEFMAQKTLVTLYRQYDGHPHALGAEIKERLLPGKVINGFTATNSDDFNGMGCLAAALIEHLKEGIGNVYIYPPDSEDVGEEYTYTIYSVGASGRICLSVYENHAQTATGFTGKLLFDGFLVDFDPATCK